MTDPTPATPALIPRALLFGNPERTRARISPDGARLGYLAPSDGVVSVWVRSIDTDDDRVVAHDPVRPIPWFAWSGDGMAVLYLQDHGGDENHHLYYAALDGSAPRDLTPGDGVKVGSVTVDPRHPHTVLASSNARDARLFDVRRIDTADGTDVIDAENPGNVTSWLADPALVTRARRARAADGSSAIEVRDDASSPWRTLETFGPDDGSHRLVAFSPDGHALYAITAKGAEAARLLRYDVATGIATVVLADAHYDAADTFVDPATRDVVAAAIVRERVAWSALDPAFASDLAALLALHHGDLQIADASADGNVLVAQFTDDAGPIAYYAYDRRTRRGTPLFTEQPALMAHRLAPMRPVSFAARDGLMLHGYLTLPTGVVPERLPTVLYVHGGPWYRDRWGYEPIVQWLANRGYAVLQVNFRGSTGYGKAFMNAGDREWSGAMRTDLLDARDWAVAQGIADPSRFAIFGGSYGGYAVLAALTFAPDTFTCGVDLCGPSNLETFLDAIPPYWSTMRSVLTQRMGDDAAFLAASSPLHRAGAIRAPLLIGQGANDPRVRQAESDQIVAAMRANDVPVTYVVFDDEGHGFARPENATRFTAAAEAFLARHLGGRLEPPHPGEEIEPYLR
ncbi:MAG: S9 family peptidase [Candidatus Eremiobacteraeota bacterium]|nr:S9 family peptidase [Candidatus Eremiobacteraeota bacterium]